MRPNPDLICIIDNRRAWKRKRTALVRAGKLEHTTGDFEIGVMIQTNLRARRSSLPARAAALQIINEKSRQQRANAALARVGGAK